MSSRNPLHRDALSLRLFLKSSPKDVSEHEVEYFRAHPEEIDEISAAVNIHKLFLWGGLLMGTVLLGASKAITHAELLASVPQGIEEFVVDFIFEVGVALIGAAITAYILGILLNRQQEDAAEWRAEIRRRIASNSHED